MTIETLNKYADPAPYKIRANKREEPGDGLARLDIAKLTIRLTETPKVLPDLKTLRLGAHSTDHMATVSFDPVYGWSPPEIKPYGPLTLDPASSCFQYGAGLFEGMKAYLGPDGKARLFRPDLNMRRFERSVARLALPPIDGDVILELIKRFVRIEKRWIPALSGHSLYLRPTVIGTRPELGMTPCDHSMLYILATPCGAYFRRPLSLLAVGDFVRAWPGGTGGEKVGGNYAPGFLPLRRAAEQGYDQVLWLFGEKNWVTEGGAMNIFIVLERADGDGVDVVTPPLDGTILPGVTRASCLELASDPDFHASVVFDLTSNNGTTLHPVERGFTVTDLERWSIDGTLLEVFCVGTASIVAAVHRIGFEGRDIHVPTHLTDENGLGPVGGAFREKILAVQEGREEYKGWGVVCE